MSKSDEETDEQVNCKASRIVTGVAGPWTHAVDTAFLATMLCSLDIEPIVASRVSAVDTGVW